ncbi:MAG: endo alpha-1,4 polygalactosaminidase [Candidatus Dadabacteria bacterium]|nr:MAG: endo alpha-1,4 polygalactosaminidase [Candidatus Dadabacteria bacterium]
MKRLLLPLLWLAACAQAPDLPRPLSPPSGADAPFATGASWYWQLNGDLHSDVQAQVYDIDLFDTPATTIAALRDRGIAVICYFSAGSYENWRPDADAFPADALGEPLDGWEGERWLDIRDNALRPILEQRLDLAVSKGCDAVEPDNVDGWTNRTGFPLSADDQLAFNRWLAQQAHARGLLVGLKNDLDQIGALEAAFDFAINEQCLAFDECSAYAPFVAAGKAVFHAEYPGHPLNEKELQAICTRPERTGLSTLIAPLNLDGRWWQYC